MIYFTSDLHLKDDRPHKLLNRRLVEDRTDWDNILRDKWNAIVKPEDTVYILGDIGRTNGDISFVGQLNGEKILIKGNHDNAGNLVYQRYFSEIHQNLLLEDVLSVPVYCTHKPCDYKPGMFNLVGHVHDTWKHKRNMINVGIENWGLAPISVDQLNEAIEVNQKYLDENDFLFDNDNPKSKSKLSPTIYLCSDSDEGLDFNPRYETWVDTLFRKSNIKCHKNTDIIPCITNDSRLYTAKYQIYNMHIKNSNLGYLNLFAKIMSIVDNVDVKMYIIINIENVSYEEMVNLDKTIDNIKNINKNVNIIKHTNMSNAVDALAELIKKENLYIGD